MEGGDSSVVVSAPLKARREGSIYEKYLNIKNNVLTDEEDGAVKTCTEISNSTAMRDSASIKSTDVGFRMTSPRNGRHGGFRSPRMEGSFGRVSPPRMMGGPGGPLGRGRSRSRSRSRGRNGMGVPGDINGGNRPRSPPRGPPESGRFDCCSSGGSGHFNRPPGDTFGGRRVSPGRGAFIERIGSPRRGGFDGRPGSPRRDGLNGRPVSPPRSGFNGPPGSPPRGGFNGPPCSPRRGGFDGRPGSPPRGGFNGPLCSPRRGGFDGRPGSPRRDGLNGRPGSPPRGGFNRPPGSPRRGGLDGRPGSPPRAGFGGRPGSSPCDGFDGRRGSPRRGDFDGRSGSPRRDGCYGRPVSPPRGGFGGAPANVLRNGFGGDRSPPRGFDGGRGSPRFDGFIGPPGGLRGRSPPRDDFRRGPPISPGRDCAPRDIRGGVMDGHGSGGPRRSRSRSQPRGLPRSPPRSYDCGPFDSRPGRPQGPLRNDFGGRDPGDLPPFEGRGPLPIRRPSSPPRDGNFGPRFDNRGPPIDSRSPSSGRNGPPNMFPPRGRSRSPNGQPLGEMMRKRDRSWDRGGPPRDMMQRPFNGPVPDSPRLMEPGPYDLERPNVRRVVYELKPESMADASGYREFVDYLILGRGGHARAGAATEMESQGFKIFLLPPGQAARQLGYKGDHMVAVLRSR